MEQVFELLIKTFVEPVQIVLIAWIIALHWDKRDEKKIAVKRQDGDEKRNEALIGMSKTIDMIMNKISGGRP